jgi:hypothetical protein
MQKDKLLFLTQSQPLGFTNKSQMLGREARKHPAKLPSQPMSQKESLLHTVSKKKKKRKKERKTENPQTGCPSFILPDFLLLVFFLCSLPVNLLLASSIDLWWTKFHFIFNKQNS